MTRSTAPWRRAQRAALALLVLLCSSCAGLDPNNIIGRQLGEAPPVSTSPVPPPPHEGLDAAERARAFDMVWETIAERYHDPRFNGVDWKAVGAKYRPLALAATDDDAFWRTLDRMVGELRDSHTRVESPREVALRKRDQSITLGFSFLPIDGRLAVWSVRPDSDAWWAGVRPGMLIVAIGDQPALDVYRRIGADSRLDSTDRAHHLRAVHELITGKAGSKVAFTFERADGSRFDATLTRRRTTFHPAELHRVLPSGFGYIRLTRWTVGQTLRALSGLETLRHTPGLVIDLRGNPGGSVHAVNLMLRRFFTKPTELGRATTRNGRPVSLLFGAVDIIKLERHVDGDPDAYRGPVAILVNSLSASASELFSSTMQATGRARVVGEPSCGCMLGFLGYANVPGGAELAYSEVGFVLPNGKRIEGEGVIPDVPVPTTLADLRAGRDRALEEAQALLARLAVHQAAR